MATTVTDKKILSIALALNFIMFVVGLIAGIIAESTGLIADSLDMLVDASAYALGLLAVGRGMRFKTTIAALCGSILFLFHSVVCRSLSALTITDTEESAIAAAAMIGLKSNPVNGYKIPAAKGTPKML
ncbi:Cation efflux family protein [Legionella spiritensis]|uniref:Cation efflux family protein n=1 Tax=Legionella spiritensis TaxID=452 RepID=A0A0W0Z5N6_LEGSP|nr:Cation efflux family protein [Legionella spiritensis]SNV45720.1 cation diffusion facilitator family transporter [Legionella spiritensis]